MPEQLEGSCQDVLAGQMQYTYFPVTPKMLQAEVHFENQEAHECHYEGYSVSYILANHPTNTAIYKIKAAGKTIVFAPDNELIPHQEPEESSFLKLLIDFCSEADLLIHDGQYSYANYDQFRSWGHSPWEETVKMAKAALVKRLVIFSHDPASTDDDLDRLDHQLRTHADDFESIQLAREFSVLQ
ncbi:MBL fold metallo-hydrolase, partial [Arthrospira platensis SPKY1]|nr:MBL fold metallo-hydrolase [Arthrospira platensis SPKY1]